MDTFEQAGHRAIRSIGGFLYTDALSRQLNELLARVDRGEVISTEDARIVVRTLVELDDLSKRTRDKAKRIEAEAAKMPPECQEAYRDELARGRR